MRIYIFLIGLTVSLLLASCVTTTDQVLRTRSLGMVGNPMVSSESNGSFSGLKPLVMQATNTNIVFVHGIGWTQENGSTEFGDNLLLALQRSYPGATISSDRYTCPKSSRELAQTEKNGRNGLTLLSSATKPLQTDDPNFALEIKQIGCLDKAVINIPSAETKTLTVYRLFWDDAMWNSAEWFHMGYDGGLLTENGEKIRFSGYEDVDQFRAPFNSELKRSMMTYGLVDAALYMSPAGRHMREGVEAAICAAVLGSFTNTLNNGVSATPTDLCSHTPGSEEPLILISHSLGSRVMFDTVVSDLTTTLAVIIAKGVANQTLELHMFANQIPLVGAGRLGTLRSDKRIDGKSIKLVAYSEINDLLTYELVPYFEQLYYVRCFGGASEKKSCLPKAKDSWKQRRESFDEDLKSRRKLVADLGFDVVDVRLQFAPNLIPMYSGFKNPSVAHSGHLESDTVLSLLLCGLGNEKQPLVPEECKRR